MDSNNGNNNEQHVEPIANDVKGTVKWFHRNKGYGFVTRDDTKEDIFIHYSGIKPDGTTINKRQIKKRLNLMDNEKVSFDVVKNGNKLEARNVTGKNGSLILDIIAYKRGIRPMNLEIVNEQRLTGKVKWFNVKSKYGYIQCDYNNEDVYVNAKAITNNNPNKYKPSLHDGEAVEFDLMKRRDGKLEAVNVTGPNGNPVQGSEYSPDKTDKSSQPCVEAGLSGRVKWFNLKSGFGYITRNDNSQDIYVHYSSIKAKNPNHRLRSLNDGETVLFNLIESNRGPEAVDVTGPNGNPVQGSGRVRPSRGMDGMQRGGMPRGGLRRGGPPPPNGMMRNGRPSRGGNRPLPPPPPPLQQQQPPQQQQQQGPPQNRRPRPPSGGPNNLNRPRTRNMNPNYMKNPYNNENLYNNDEPMYYTFKPKSKPAYSPFENANPRRIPFDKYVNMMNRPNNRGRGPPMQQQSPPMVRNGPPRNFQPPNMNNLVLVLERVNGKVKWYNFKRGYGFVTRFDNGQDIFVHQSGIRLAYGGMRPSLDDGENVEFDIYQDNGQLIAVNVTGPGGLSVKGSRYANSRSPIKTTVYRRRRTSNQPNQLH